MNTLRKLALVAVSFTLLASAAWSAPPQRTHEITVDDYLSVYLIPECATAPDGQHVAFTELRWFDHDEPRTTELWVVNTETKRTERLTFNRVSDSSPQWTPDSQHIYFLSKCNRGEKRPPYDGSQQVWVTGLEPGEPRAVTFVAGGVESFELGRDGRTLFYAKEGDEAEQEWKELRKKYASIRVNEGPVKYTEIWKLDLQGWREEKLVAPQRVITEFKVTLDGARIALVTTPDARLLTKEGQSRVDIHDVKSGQTTTLPDKLFRADAPSPYGWVENLAWSPDGQRLAWTVGFDGYQTEILLAEWAAGEPTVRMLKRPDEVSVSGQLRWSAPADLCFLAERRARQQVYCLAGLRDGGPGAARALTPPDAVALAYSIDDQQQLAFVLSTCEIAADVFWSAPAAPVPVRLTNINPQIDTWKLPQISLVTWKAPDGAEVEGILELPPGYEPGQGPLPMIVELHGGPSDATRYHLRYWIYGRTVLAAKGYALLSPNYRGSTGYGDKFMTDLIGRENDIEVKDILVGVDALVERGIADPERLGVMGWSNGGFLVNCLITTTQRFKAASSGAGVLDMFMQWGLEDTPNHVINFMRGLPWERAEAYIKASPAYKLGAVKTPTIVHVGEDDTRVPAAHSRALFRALKDYTNVPTLLLTYPKAGHGLAVSDHRKGKLDWDVAWFDRYLLGKGDKPAEKPDQPAEKADKSPGK